MPCERFDVIKHWHLGARREAISMPYLRARLVAPYESVQIRRLNAELAEKSSAFFIAGFAVSHVERDLLTLSDAISQAWLREPKNHLPQLKGRRLKGGAWAGRGRARTRASAMEKALTPAGFCPFISNGGANLPHGLERFSVGCRRRASARRLAGLKAGRYTDIENALDYLPIPMSGQ